MVERLTMHSLPPCSSHGTTNSNKFPEGRRKAVLVLTHITATVHGSGGDSTHIPSGLRQHHLEGGLAGCYTQRSSGSCQTQQTGLRPLRKNPLRSNSKECAKTPQVSGQHMHQISNGARKQSIKQSNEQKEASKGTGAFKAGEKNTETEMKCLRK